MEEVEANSGASRTHGKFKRGKIGNSKFGRASDLEGLGEGGDLGGMFMLWFDFLAFLARFGVGCCLDMGPPRPPFTSSRAD